MDNNLINTLYDIKDRCFVYSVMLTEASSSLGKMKLMFKLPAIFISIVLSVINSSKFNENDAINIVNTIFNALIALMIGVENTLQLDNKRQVFTTTKNKFEKLHSNIEKRLLDIAEPMSVEFVQNAIEEFEQIDDDLTFDIPKSIRERAKSNFLNKRTLPLILGGDKVVQHIVNKELETYKPQLKETINKSDNIKLVQQVQLQQPGQQSHAAELSQQVQSSYNAQILQASPPVQLPQIIQQLQQIQPVSSDIQEKETVHNMIKPLNIKPLDNIKEEADIIDEIPIYNNMSI